MTLEVFKHDVSRLAVAVSLFALMGCGPTEEGASVEVASASRALSTVSYRSSSTASGKSITSLSIGKPAGTVAGDVLLARIINRNNATAIATAPAGWTLLRSDQSASQIKAWVKNLFH